MDKIIYLFLILIFSFFLSACNKGEKYMIENDVDSTEMKINIANAYYLADDFERAFLLYREAANIGDLFAQYMLAEMYFNGEGVQQNYETAIYWYKKSVDINSDHPYPPEQALVQLGNCYKDGIGVEKNLVLSYAYYKIAQKIGLSDGTWVDYNDILSRLDGKMSKEELLEAKHIAEKYILKFIDFFGIASRKASDGDISDGND